MMDDVLIAKLIAKGGKRWTKGKHDRIYFGATKLGLRVEYYNTGNVRQGYFNGEPMISNSETRRYLSAQTYIDVKTGEITSDYDCLGQALTELVDQAGSKLTVEQNRKDETNMMNEDKILDSKLFAAFRERRDAATINRYLGAGTVEEYLAPYLTEEGELCAPDVLEETLHLDDEPARINFYLNQIIQDIDHRIIEKWISELTREQGEMICRTVGYDNSVLIVGTKIDTINIAYRWYKYHPGEACLSICREWDGE